MIFSELDLAGMLNADDDVFGPETTRGEIPEYLFWSTFCVLLERIEPQSEAAIGRTQPGTPERPGPR
jgi:hypothetical protein